MSEQVLPKEENLIIFKEIETKPTVTQRELSIKLGVSLGKINYLLKELIKKGLIEVKTSQTTPANLRKFSIILPKKDWNTKSKLPAISCRKKSLNITG